VIGLALEHRRRYGISRVVTTFHTVVFSKTGPPRQPAAGINLRQISEFSLVVLQTGVAAGQHKTQTASAASLPSIFSGCSAPS